MQLGPHDRPDLGQVMGGPIWWPPDLAGNKTGTQLRVYDRSGRDSVNCNLKADLAAKGQSAPSSLDDFVKKKKGRRKTLEKSAALCGDGCRLGRWSMPPWMISPPVKLGIPAGYSSSMVGKLLLLRWLSARAPRRAFGKGHFTMLMFAGTSGARLHCGGLYPGARAYWPDGRAAKQYTGPPFPHLDPIFKTLAPGPEVNAPRNRGGPLEIGTAKRAPPKDGLPFPCVRFGAGTIALKMGATKRKSKWGVDGRFTPKAQYP